MTHKRAAITGFGSVTPFGPLAGLIPVSPVEPSAITAWTTDGLRRGFTVKPFQPSSVIPGLKTRRLDLLSAWGLVAASLALQDAGIDLKQMDQIDRSRIAVVFATSFGCIELTESFFKSASINGWSGTDPITFPETLANLPAGHVALFHDMRGPNITVSSKNFSAESALLQADSLLRLGQADIAVVLAGDTLTQTMYEWFEAARLLSPVCYNEDPLSANAGFVPTEGVVALVMEPEGRQGARSYAHLRRGRWATGGDSLASVRKMLGDVVPSLTICAGNGTPCDTGPEQDLAGNFAAPNTKTLPAQAVALGLSDTGALFHLLLALSTRPGSGQALMLSTSRSSGYAALLLDLP